MVTSTLYICFCIPTSVRLVPMYDLVCTLCIVLSLTKRRAAMRVATPSLERVWLRQTMVVLAFPRPAGRCASAPLIMRFAKEPVYNPTIMRMRRTLKPTCSPLIIEFRSYTWSWVDHTSPAVCWYFWLEGSVSRRRVPSLVSSHLDLVVPTYLNACK